MITRYAVYIMTNRHHTVYYIGVTGNLSLRLHYHLRKDRSRRFTARYHIDQLVYYEQHQRVMDAIRREKQLKRWRRSKKLALIRRVNPDLQDLKASLR